MYAPKFISWMTDEERFHSALDARIAPMLEAMRAECKQMRVKAEEDLRLRPTKEETDLQMKYNQATGLVSYYNAHQKLNNWEAMLLQGMQNSMAATWMKNSMAATGNLPALGNSYASAIRGAE